MNDNHHTDRELLEKVERRVRDGRLPGDALLDDLVEAAPQADAGFQRKLEERLLNILTQPEEMPMTLPTHTHEPHWRERSQIPLTLAAALLVLILLGTLVTSNRPASEGTMMAGAQADLRQTEIAIQATQTRVAQEQTRLETALTHMRLSNRSFAYGGHVTRVDHPQAIEAMRRAQMTWVKIRLQGTSIENYAFAEDVIQTAHDNGFLILITVDGSPEAIQNENFAEAYANYVRGIARMGADAIEVWSEPNIDRTWPTGEISGAAYVDLLKTAYQAIKAENPNTLVISGAPAPTGAESSFPGQVMNDDNWLREVVASGGLDYLDCVGVHYNEGVVAPDQLQGDPRDNTHRRYLGSMVAAYREVTLEQKPLCFTELGYLTSEGLGELSMPFSWAADNTLAEQAAWLAQAVTLAEQSGMVRLLIVWNVDFTRFDANPDAGFAIMRPDGSCPACEAMAEINFSEADGVEAIAISDETTLCQVVSREPNMYVAVRAAPDESADRLGSVPYGPILDVRDQRIGHDQQLWFLIMLKLDLAQLTGWVPAEAVVPTTICPPLEGNAVLHPLPTSTQLEMREIVVATHNLPARRRIGQDDVTLRWWPASAGVNAFTVLEDVIGTYTRGEIFHEQPILRSMIADELPTAVPQNQAQGAQTAILCQVTAHEPNATLVIRAEPDIASEPVGSVDNTVVLDVLGQSVNEGGRWYWVAVEMGNAYVSGWVRAIVVQETIACPSILE